jgi:crotonobetainyl-CoA:carnitine CoA-transferase CaiB-like acyl-CoA transferase
MDWKSGRLPLVGLRVIDWSVYWAGPLLGMMLHDLGAEVIKLESPSNWDPLRTVIDVNRYAGEQSRPLTPQERANINQHFNEWNRGKLGLGLDLVDPRGRALLLALAAESHIFIENHRPGAKKKLGIGYDELRAVRPDIIYVSVSGYGQTPPERDAMALGAPVELASGLFSLNGYLNDTTPAKTGFSYGDPVGALAAGSAVLLAVRRQRRTGEGRQIDLSKRDALAFGVGAAFTDWSMNHVERPRRGNRHPIYAPQGVYRAAGDDEWVAISVRDDRDWQALGRVLGDPEWQRDPELATAGGRRRRHDEIDGQIEAWTSQRAARQIEAALQGAGVPAGAVLDFRQLWHDPQLNARGAFREIVHPAFGVEVRSTSQWERGPLAPPIDRPAPCFGQHNREVLTGILGLDKAAIGQLECDGVIANEIKVSVD